MVSELPARGDQRSQDREHQENPAAPLRQSAVLRRCRSLPRTAPHRHIGGEEQSGRNEITPQKYAYNSVSKGSVVHPSTCAVVKGTDRPPGLVKKSPPGKRPRPLHPPLHPDSDRASVLPCATRAGLKRAAISTPGI
ncbi:hypothetical protein SKAU_G00322000 [Synaphobranchus kaupii]|uniref:Uncharacterized protein n=1 Tax=Synaphobranchus kaupii TaxID=118154 RepID=A0A9Q1IJM6_SYNKA|nr:hypothetical protein SKAU_G00322000 [Synaphobranchus kaupii]